MDRDRKAFPMIDEVRRLLATEGMDKNEIQAVLSKLGEELRYLSNHATVINDLRRSGDFDNVIRTVADKLARSDLFNERIQITDERQQYVSDYYYQILVGVAANAAYASLIYVLFKLIEATKHVVQFRVGSTEDDTETVLTLTMLKLLKPKPST